MKIHGLTAVITGGASGMGAATGAYLAGRGARVALLDTNADALKKQAAEIGGDACAVVCDVTDAESAERAMAEAVKAVGVPQVLVNCAGVADAGRVVGRKGPLPLEAFTKVISVNLIGSFNVMRLAAAHMMQGEPLNEDGERGVVINTASVSAFDGQIGQAAYSASKGAIVAMTLPVAREFANFGIRVMAIAPGIIHTPMLSGMPAEVQESLAAQVPFPKRLGDPVEYAKLVEHIIENPMLNGEVIRMDGAIRMQAK
ncbi:MAG: SDR family NAD(P)-dependent oxidoreductase [Gammaproteobacteria bacterium]|nr:SDR family NAD(P)-dependent oxidoreductase [Gammaproteobacteria bacterium]MDD9816346.1 SDR family NAD(P)-dependent oxidoreductase [Gammaproteobacteria bacterium]MDD9850406.1 SDR family NAD(P)-dependent oxidoreductase [Gammaproteobacteria bacterium]